jgi:hypothetical protein
VDVAFLVADVRFLVAFVVDTAAFSRGREAFGPERPSTVSVPAAGTTEVSSSDNQRTRSIEPVTPVTVPSRSVPLLSLRRLEKRPLRIAGSECLGDQLGVHVLPDFLDRAAVEANDPAVVVS